jgi:hypothetical protein
MTTAVLGTGFAGRTLAAWLVGVGHDVLMDHSDFNFYLARV